ncbi:hypothetical protein FOA52_007760 [Chlamydomonas sp. UWO 241]|nr:hypothetical protein FOA52_007760 [Chlamydomonas sp. UWO 241]
MTDDIREPKKAYTAQERVSLERLVRRALSLPSRPALLLLHSYTDRLPVSFGMVAEDWHNLVAQHYGNVQVLSLRNSVYELWLNHSSVPSELGVYMDDGVHPVQLGHYLWADVLISALKAHVLRAMADLTLASLLPGATLAHPLPLAPHAPNMTTAGVMEPLPTFVTQYTARWSGLPDPLFEANRLLVHGRCFFEDELLAISSAASGFEWVGRARVECTSGCTCSPLVINALWHKTHSQTAFAALRVTRHARCLLLVTTLEPGPEPARQGSSKFKLTSLVVTLNASDTGAFVGGEQLSEILHWNGFAE